MENKRSEVKELPKFTSNCEVEEYIILMLAKAGWYGSNPSTILSAPTDWVMKCFHFENFTNDFKNEIMEQQLNK